MKKEGDPTDGGGGSVVESFKLQVRVQTYIMAAELTLEMSV